jgi:hypothetical protein
LSNRCCARSFQSLSEFGRGLTVTLEAQRAEVRKVAFAAAFGDWHDVVGIPQALAGTGADAPFKAGPRPGDTAHPLQMTPSGQAIGSTYGAYRAIAFEHFLAQVAGVSAQPPFFNAPFGTERETPFGNLEVAIAAEIPAIFPFR